MVLYRSLEIRWFLSNKPAKIASLFEENGLEPESFTGRSDEYARTNSDLYSLKFREGRLEVKIRTGVIDNRLAGHATFWKKWSYPLSNILNEPWYLLAEQDRISVKKVRGLLYTSLSTEGLHASLNSDQGCQWEYGKIFIGDESFFTFGLEAFGTDNSTMEYQLEHACNILSKLSVDNDLTRDQLMDYPEFLAKR